jgi:hypothetical protein
MNNRIQIFDNSGKFKSQCRGDGYLEGSVDQSEPNPRHIIWYEQIHNEDKVPVKKPAGFFIEGGSFSTQLFIADSGNNKIKRTASSGVLYSSAGRKGGEFGCFNSPAVVFYDMEMDQLIVADSGNNRLEVLQLRSHGEFFSTDAMTCVQEINNQNLSQPLGVAVITIQPDQFIFVADTGNNRVVKLKNGIFNTGASPVDVWNKFKTALLAKDIDKALTYISSWKKDQYGEALRDPKMDLKKFVGEMGDLIPSSIESGMARYELMCKDPNGSVFAYPVDFGQDEHGDWKILSF